MEENEVVKMSDERVKEIVTDMIGDTQNSIENKDFDVLSFSNGLRAGLSTWLTPQMINRNMKNVNLNPTVSTYEEIIEALNNAKDNEDLIISQCQQQYLTSTLFKRNFDYYANLLVFNLEILPKQSIEKSEYNSKKFKKDLSLVEDFFDKFNYREEFKKATFNMLNADFYPCVFRTDLSEDRWVLQDFPYRNALITGRFSHGILCDYDLSLFMTGTQDIFLYPKWVRKKYSDLINPDKYVPHNTINHRTGKFAYWVQTSPKEEKNPYGFYDGAWCFKFSPDFITEIPYFAPMALDTSLSTPYRSLQYNQAIASARKIITAQWPLLKDTTSGKQADALAIRTETMGKILGAAMAGLNVDGNLFNLLAIPSDKIEVHQMENKNGTMYTEYLKTVSGLLGGANTLFSVQKQTATESLISADLDKLLMEKVYAQFEDFLDYYVNMRTQKYKFKFVFSGTKMYMDKEARMKAAYEPAKTGFVSINKISSAWDMNMFEFKREMEMTKNVFDLDSMFTILPNMFTKSSGESDSGGRPQSSSSELSDSAVASRDSGSNIEKGGNV